MWTSCHSNRCGKVFEVVLQDACDRNPSYQVILNLGVTKTRARYAFTYVWKCNPIVLMKSVVRTVRDNGHRHHVHVLSRQPCSSFFLDPFRWGVCLFSAALVVVFLDPFFIRRGTPTSHTKRGWLRYLNHCYARED